MQDVSAASSLVCPSFSAYFADEISQTAARVRHELAADLESPAQSQNDDFEFAALRPDPDLPSLSSFPIFSWNSSAKAEDRNPVEVKVVDDKLEPLRISFRNLLVDDRDLPSSSSSAEEDEADELDGVPSGTFCICCPRRSAHSSPNGCRKSNSTGSSSKTPKRCRLADLILRRSKSDGKRLSPPSSKSTSSVFPNSTYPASSPPTKKPEEKKRMKKVLPSQHELFYGRNGLKTEGERRRTYLPYRKDLVGIFAIAHGLGRIIACF